MNAARNESCYVRTPFDLVRIVRAADWCWTEVIHITHSGPGLFNGEVGLFYDELRPLL
jgi:hypothetical protein